jgi:hypothetical protein
VRRKEIKNFVWKTPEAGIATNVFNWVTLKRINPKSVETVSGIKSSTTKIVEKNYKPEDVVITEIITSDYVLIMSPHKARQ